MAFFNSFRYPSQRVSSALWASGGAVFFTAILYWCSCGATASAVGSVSSASVLGASHAAAGDLQLLVHSLEGRLAKLGQGTIHYEYYKFRCTPGDFRKIKDAFDRKNAGSSVLKRNKRLRALLYGPSIHRVTAYRGTMYYMAKGKRWRLVKKSIRGYGLGVKALTRLAAKKFPKLAHAEKLNVILNTSEDVSYDGKTLMRLENNKTLIKSGISPGLNYPTIMSLDISLAPWQLAIESPALANQTIAADTQGGVWSISYLDRTAGGGSSDETAEFDVARGFAPIRILGTTNNKTTSETLFHCHSARGNFYKVDSVLICNYPVAPGAKLGGAIFLINSWSNKVAKKDLEVKLPRKYLLIDERYGDASPIFKIIHGNSSTRPAPGSGGGGGN
jgi:hypothetical protein